MLLPVIELGIKRETRLTPSFYAPSPALSRWACGWYGVGHTTRREPGDMRGTVVGKKGRFKGLLHTRGGDA
jgi:hypothetical protein